MTAQFVDTPTNMVRVVQNAIEGYDMGSIRALAQEPVQNSLDAGVGGRVYVDYRLLRRRGSGADCWLLTVTDSGTCGLKGPILPASERDRRGSQLGEGENWAAFEGQGYTRKQGDALGSRGQGKSALLYHSRPPRRGSHAPQRMLMLYDTLLEDGEYRFGVRCAMPADQVLEPPRRGQAAIAELAGSFAEIEGLAVPLALEPLAQPGTRVVVPYLSEEAREAIVSRELVRWLQRLWWRPIQAGRLQVSVDAGNGARRIRVPRWWEGEPWREGDARVLVRERIGIPSGQAIERLVLFHDGRLRADEIPGYGPQFAGVQLLRGGQWIETHDIRDLVPAPQRAGFRGFCEFDIELERELKRSERPQHERFDGRFKAVRDVRAVIDSALREFAAARGWIGETAARDAPVIEQQVANQFLVAFAAGAGDGALPGQRSPLAPSAAEQLDWTCRLDLGFPEPATARVNWGQRLTDARVKVRCEPVPEEARFVEVSLELGRRFEAERTIIDTRRNVRVQSGRASVAFWDLEVVRDPDPAAAICAPEPGEWNLRVRVAHLGTVVAAASRRLFVESDPPPPRRRPQTVAVSARNLSTGRHRRFDDGDLLALKVAATNRDILGVNLRVDAWLDENPLCEKHFVFLPALADGDRPVPTVAFARSLRVNSLHERVGDGEIFLAPGRHTAGAAIYPASSDEPLARSSHQFFVESDPGHELANLPFELEALDEQGPTAMWRLVQEQSGRTLLRYPSSYPLYRNLARAPEADDGLPGQSAFIAEVCANGLLEWALDPVTDADLGRIDQLKASRPRGIGVDRWDEYCERLELLAQHYEGERNENFGRFMERWRECVAFMLDIFADIE